MRSVDVVVPLGGDAGLALSSANAALASSNATPCEVIVVASSAEHARAFASEAAQADTRLRVIDTHAGTSYATLVARAFALHADRDVVLLEPGAVVHGDWLDRLAAHANEPVVGIVGACSGGYGAAFRAVQNGADDNVAAGALDALSARVNRGESTSVASVASACLYLKRACIDAIGPARIAASEQSWWLDVARRAREAGFDTRIAGDVFVPGGGVNEFPADDAGGDALRLYAGRVDVATLAASPRPAIVFVSHAWHGGIRRHMDDLAVLIADRADVLYLEPADPDTVKLYRPDQPSACALWFRLPAELPALAQTLRAIGVVRLHVHHVHGLPRAILDLPGAADLPYDCTLHDYYPVCPQYHLADADGRFCGEPDAANCDACLAGRPPQWGLSVDEWRATLGAFVRCAARVIAPSHDVAARVGRQLPGLAIDVWPHPEPVRAAARPVARVVTLGALSREKGLAVVAACARDAQVRELPLTFRVLGPTAEPLPRWPEASLTVHGSYDESALPALLAAERPDVLFFPAQVPETYSYTLSAALATSTPIVASALGAFVERLEGRRNVRLLPWHASAQDWNAALLDVSQTLAQGGVDAPALADAMRAV